MYVCDSLNKSISEVFHCRHGYKYYVFCQKERTTIVKLVHQNCKKIDNLVHFSEYYFI